MRRCRITIAWIRSTLRMSTFWSGFMETIGEECRREVAVLDLSLCMSRKALRVLPQLLVFANGQLVSIPI